MSDWLERVGEFSRLEPQARELLAALRPTTIPSGTIIFHPGDATHNFPIILSGRVGVYMTGATGREILLYTVIPGETCVQTTLGLLGGADYSAEAIAETAVEAVIVPRTVFEKLLATSATFRSYVFGAFAGRMQALMRALERVAFIKVEARLAAILVERADEQGRIVQTHHELATAIGSVREVVSRRLESLARRGLVDLERGQVRIVDIEELQSLADSHD